VATQISLKKRKNETFDELEILFLVYRVSAALRFCHFAEIVHGDLKP
jgi:serine/threonine protein kinase